MEYKGVTKYQSLLRLERLTFGEKCEAEGIKQGGNQYKRSAARTGRSVNMGMGIVDSCGNKMRSGCVYRRSQAVQCTKDNASTRTRAKADLKVWFPSGTGSTGSL